MTVSPSAGGLFCGIVQFFSGWILWSSAKGRVERGSVSYCFELSVSALSALSVCFHFTYFYYACPFVYAVHLAVSHYFFQIKTLVFCLWETWRRWEVVFGREAEGRRSQGSDHSVVYSFQLLIFRLVPWLHSAVTSPFKSELLRGFGTHQHASQWYPSPCSPFR